MGTVPLCCSFCQELAEDYFLEQIDILPPLVSKEEVDKFLPKELQFNSAEELQIWETSASKKEKQKRKDGLENLFSLVERRFWVVNFIHPN